MLALGAREARAGSNKSCLLFGGIIT